MDEPEWDNANVNSDEDDEYSTLGLGDPLHWVEDSEDSDCNSGHAQQTVHTGALSPQEYEQLHASDPTSSTGTLLTLPVTFNEYAHFTVYVSLLVCNALYRCMTTPMNNSVPYV